MVAMCEMTTQIYLKLAPTSTGIRASAQVMQFHEQSSSTVLPTRNLPQT